MNNIMEVIWSQFLGEGLAVYMYVYNVKWYDFEHIRSILALNCIVVL